MRLVPKIAAPYSHFCQIEEYVVAGLLKASLQRTENVKRVSLLCVPPGRRVA